MSKIKIIVIDDERSSREELKSEIKKHSDFEIIGETQVSKISLESKLLENAREGRVECVKELIAQGVMVDFADN